METDAVYRARLIKCVTDLIGQPSPDTLMRLRMDYGAALDAIGEAFGFPRMRLVSPDPFGDRIAEALRREDDVVPHPVKRVETRDEVDALWRSIEEYGRGG